MHQINIFLLERLRALKVSKHTVLCAIILFAFIPLLTPSGVSVNFSFLFLLLLCPIYRFDVLPAYVIGFLLAAILSYLFAFLFYFSETQYFEKQFLSFGAFISFLLILLIRIPVALETIYKMLVIVCTAYSFLVLYHISTNANFNLGDFRFIKSGMRDYVTHWPQRFPTVMMAAFFLLFKSKTNKTYLIPLLLVSVCLFFTFTRAIYVSIIMGFLYLVFFYLLKFKVRLKKKSMFFFAVYASLIIGLIYFLQGAQLEAITVLLSVLAEGFSSIVNFLDGNVTGERSGGSDSIRIYHWKKTLELWSDRPLLGTGFAGIYQFSSMGSVHNQYIDVLFQTGIVGLFFYLYLWFIAFRYSFNKPELFSGLLAIFFYGLFHETTKLSYVGFLLVLICSKSFEASLPTQKNEN